MGRREEASKWLRGLLDAGPMAAADIAKLADEKGIRPATLRRAATAIEVVRTKHGTGGWEWSLAEDARGDGSTLGGSGGDATQDAQRAFALLGALLLEDGRHWGEAATAWQREDARAILDPSPPHMHYLTRARGGSKTGDLGGVAIATLLELLPGASRSYAFAGDRDQAGLLIDAISGFVGRTPGLAGALRVDNYRVTATRGGARLDVMASDDASAWGLRGHLYICDEFASWSMTPGPARLWTAIASAVPKVPDCRLVILTTAGAPDHPAAKVLAQAKDSAAWRVHEVPGPVPWISEASLAEQKRLLTESAYARLHENKWTSSEDRLVSAEDLAACVTNDGPQEPRPGVRYALSLDMAYVNDQAVIAVCHRDGDRVVLDRMHAWKGSRLRPIREADVEETLLEAHRAYHRPKVLCDPWQTKGMAQRLRAKGVNVTEFVFSATSVGRIALALYRLLRDHTIALYDDEALLTELARVQLREQAPGTYRLDHAHGEHDDRAVALAMCAAELVDRAVATGTGTSFSGPPIPRRPAPEITAPWAPPAWVR